MKQEYTALATPHISPTSVNDLACSKRFWTLRVLKQWPPRPPQTYSAFGTAVHAISARVFDPKNSPLPNLDHLEIWAREAFFKARYADRDARQRDMDRAKRMVVGYTQQIDCEEAEGTIATERPMHVPIFVDGRLLFVLSCVADRLLVHANDPDTLVVVDLKTGKPKIELDQSCVALAILKMTMPGYARFVLHYDWIDEGGRVDRDTVTTADVKGIWPRILSRAVEVLTAEEHLSEPNPGCVYCCLRPSCQPEVGVALDDATDLFEE